MKHDSRVSAVDARRRTRGLIQGMCSCALAAVFAITMAVPTPAYADTAAEKQAEAQEALTKLNAMQETLDVASADYGEALQAQAEAEAARDEASARIDEIDQELSEVQSRLNSRAREMYRSGSTTYLDVLLGADTFEQFATSWDLLNRLNEGDADLVQQEKDLKAEAVEQHDVYTQQAELATQKAQEAEQIAAEAQATVSEMQATYDSLSAEAQQLLEEERAAQEAAQAATAQATVDASAAAASDNASAASGGDDTTYYSDDSSSYSSSDSSSSSSSSGTYEGGTDVVSRAYACLGAPYAWGAVGPDSYDCSGLVSYCLTGSHTRLGTTYTFMTWTQVSDPQPGDVCTSWSHCGIYIGGGQMIHAADYGIGVIIGPVQSDMIIVRY